MQHDHEPTMLPIGKIYKDGTTDGYFEKKFTRIFNGEAYPSQLRHGMSTRLPFYTGKLLMKIDSPGSYSGCFDDHVEAFSPALRDKPPEEKHLPNFITTPGKKGGYGYIDIAIGKYPEHK